MKIPGYVFSSLWPKAAFKRDAIGSATAAQEPRRKIEYNRGVYTATRVLAADAQLLRAPAAI